MRSTDEVRSLVAVFCSSCLPFPFGRINRCSAHVVHDVRLRAVIEQIVDNLDPSGLSAKKRVV